MQLFYVFLCVLLLSACSTPLINELEKSPDYQVSKHHGGPFWHQTVYRKASYAPAAKTNDSETLHVYIEGDGRPWYTPSQVAWDPTPKRPLMLQLMTMDTASVLYLGRPCYFIEDDPACSPIWWTHQRYAPEVITSMNRALDVFIQPGNPIVLIGHSGGGTLAMLMAAKRSDISAVVTLAGNLDVEAWAEWHGYSPLLGSLNPVDFPLASSITQLHYAAAQDQQVPAMLIEQSLDSNLSIKNKMLKYEVIDNIDHHCCWAQQWPRILDDIDTALK